MVPLLLLLLFIPPFHSLTLHYTNTSTTPPSPATITIPSVYATIGTTPTSSIVLNASFLSKETCELDRREYVGKALIYTRNVARDFFNGCNNNRKASAVTLARLAQRAGAAVVIVGQLSGIASGRAVGFTSTIDIPVVVVPREILALFHPSEDSDNDGDGDGDGGDMHSLLTQSIRVQLDPITPDEKSSIAYLVRLWQSWRVITSLIYGFELLLVAYLLYQEYTLRKTKVGLIMRGFALYSMTVSFFAVAVDPLGFQGLSYWHSSALIQLHLASIIITSALILVLWIEAAGSMNYDKKDIIIKIIYVLCTCLFVLSIIVSLPVWHSNTIFAAMDIIIFVSYFFVIGGYVFVGKDMVRIIISAPASSHQRHVLVIKIILFTLWYVLVAIGIIVVYAVNFLGPIFVLMFALLIESLGTVVAFLIMFFQPFKTKKRTPPITVGDL